MGIFANRNIKKDEELTFNYNVDRYGCVMVRRADVEFDLIISQPRGAAVFLRRAEMYWLHWWKDTNRHRGYG